MDGLKLLMKLLGIMARLELMTRRLVYQSLVLSAMYMCFLLVSGCYNPQSEALRRLLRPVAQEWSGILSSSPPASRGSDRAGPQLEWRMW